MAKIRVHELAAEIGKSNKDIINYLTQKGYDVKTAVSLVPESEIGAIRAHFGAADPGTHAGEAGAGEKKENEKPDAARKNEEKPKKKSGIMRVLRSQNAAKQLQRRPKKSAPPSGTDSLKSLVPADEERTAKAAERAATEQAKTPSAAGSGEDAKKAEAETAAAGAAVSKPTETGAARDAAKDDRTAEKKTPQGEESSQEASVRAPAGKTAEEKESGATEGKTPAANPPKAETEKPVRRESEVQARKEETTGTEHQTAANGKTREPFKQSAGETMKREESQKKEEGKKGEDRTAKPEKAASENAGNTNAVGDGRGRDARAGRERREGDSSQRGRGDQRNGTRGDRGGRGDRSGQGIGSRGGAAFDRGRGGYSGDRSGARNARGDRGGYPGRSGQGDARRGQAAGEGRGSYQGTRGGQGGYSGRGSQGTAGGYQGRGTGAGRGGAAGRSGQGGFARSGGAFGARSGGAGGFSQRGGRPGGRPGDGDGALAHKTSRDFRGNGKDRERTHEERRENGRRGGGDMTNRPNQQHRQFNRVPKALQKKNNQNPQPAKAEEKVTEIRIPERITVRELAEKMKIAPAVLVKELFMKGDMVTVNHELSYEKAEEIALDHDILCEKEEKEDVIGELLAEDQEDEKDMVPRPPVVCVMGHVDHGKTSLLDAIRHTHVTDKEAGGITQHIGAYMVSVDGRRITFLDTPGHEAFTAMRMRGANSTDIAVLVVAADDGVMPQTVEAINHAKAANVEIIVAVNKIDKPGANVDRVKQELSEYGLVAEDWGGDTVFCPVSAKTHEGIDNLLEMILLTADMMELKANPDRLARGIVLEAKLDKGRGPVASILVQKGTLHQGDFVACGAAHGKVRAMTDERGRRLHKATPSMPCEIIGLSDVPEAGEVLMAFDTDKEAKDFASVFVTEGKKSLIEETRTQMSLEDLNKQIKEGSLKELPIIVKADVQGSVEAVSQSLAKLSNDEVVVKIIHGGVGAITESDVSLAVASNAIIIGFNVRLDPTAKNIADQQKVDIHLYNVIYEAIDDVERALKGMRAAVYEEKIQGHLEIRQVFKSSSAGNIAGSYVRDGIIQRSSKVRVFRGGEKIYEGELASLKRFKDDVKEVREGFECGIVFKDWGDFDVDDTVEAYTMVEVERD